MKTIYIAFLRAINVGGRTVKMERLRALFGELGLENVRSYIQSGNVFFETDTKNRVDLTKKIERHLKEALGYEVPTMLRTVAEVEFALSLNPFKDVEMTDEVRLCIAFLSDLLPSTPALPLSTPKEDLKLLSATENEIFLVAYHASGKAVNSASFIEKTFNVKTTVRFWATTEKILTAAKS